uniref:Uncharacterized protein n=1 Tax=Timema douglasi TaxID=61478 RepID=A0A7R8VWG1_TIMDO|nr:unnamed protein product [Timema douglasi]
MQTYQVNKKSGECPQAESGEGGEIEITASQGECLDGELRSAAPQEDNNNVELAFECVDKPASIPDCGPEDVSEDSCHRPEDEVATYIGAECVDEPAGVTVDALAVEDEPGRVHDVEVIEVITKEDNDGCDLSAENYYVTAASDIAEQCQDYNEAFQGESDCYVDLSDEPNVETNNIQDDCYAYNSVEKEEEEKDPSEERREEELSEAVSPAKMDTGTSYEQEQDDLNASFKSEGTDPDHMAYEPNVEHKDDVIHESAILTTTQFLLEEDECKLETEEDPLKQVDEDDEVADEGDDYDEPLYVPGDTWDAADSDKLPGEHVDVEVIPMQEELEVRLEEGTFPVAEEALSMDWPYTVKMSPEGGSGLTLNEEENKTSQAQYPEYSTSQGVKLELEVTLTPEAVSGAESLVTSTVGGGPYSSTPPTVSKASAVAVIPPTTIVCLPSAVSAPSLLHRQSPPMASNVVSAAGMAKTAVVASSSAVPYLAVNSTTPIRALPAQMPKSQAKPKSARDNPQHETLNASNYISMKHARLARVDGITPGPLSLPGGDKLMRVSVWRVCRGRSPTRGEPLNLRVKQYRVSLDNIFTTGSVFANMTGTKDRTLFVVGNSRLRNKQLQNINRKEGSTLNTYQYLYIEYGQNESSGFQVSTGATNRNSRSAASKPPPGAVNLERSYQICQAVIQNSPNRDQLRCQLKPPPSLLTSGPSKRLEGRPTQYGVVTSSRGGSAKPFTPPLGGVRPGGFHQRQPSPPVVVRHMFTSQQGIPVTMAVLPQPPPTTEVRYRATLGQGSNHELSHTASLSLA